MAYVTPAETPITVVVDAEAFARDEVYEACERTLGSGFRCESVFSLPYTWHFTETSDGRWEHFPPGDYYTHYVLDIINEGVCDSAGLNFSTGTTMATLAPGTAMATTMMMTMTRRARNERSPAPPGLGQRPLPRSPDYCGRPPLPVVMARSAPSKERSPLPAIRFGGHCRSGRWVSPFRVGRGRVCCGGCSRTLFSRRD